MSNVASLFGSAPPVPCVDPDVISGLEELLTLARDGLIAGFAYAVVEVNGNIATGWKGIADRHRQIHAVDYLHYRMLKAEHDDD